MSEDEEEKEDDRDEVLTQAYAKTRKSLIARLDNWEDQRPGTSSIKPIGG
jgi:hypothetical protein